MKLNHHELTALEFALMFLIGDSVANHRAKYMLIGQAMPAFKLNRTETKLAKAVGYVTFYGVALEYTNA